MANSKSNKKTQKANHHFAARIIFLIILAVIIGISFIWTDQINTALKLTAIESGNFDGSSTDEVLSFKNEGGENVSGKSLTIHFVDVGQGDACIIELPDDKKMIIDGGKDKEKQKLLDYIDTKIDADNSMKNADGKNDDYAFDYAILTHSDEDHCGGLDNVLDNYSTKIFYRPNELATYNGYTDPAISLNLLELGYTEKSTLAYKRAIESGAKCEEMLVTGINNHRSVIEPDGIDEDSPLYYKFEFFTPIKNSYKNLNDYSPVMILFYQGKKIVMSGDAESAAEAEFVSAATSSNKAEKYKIFDDSFNADVIKLGHHGSRTSSGEAYLNVLLDNDLGADTLAVISCGFNNSYKHPHTETLNRLTNTFNFAAENILRTDVNSTIVLRVIELEEVIEEKTVISWQLLYGANVVKTEKAAVSIADTVNVQWREICITIWVLLALILIIQPIADVINKKKKAMEKEYKKNTDKKK